MPKRVPTFAAPRLGRLTPRQAQQRDYNLTPERIESNNFYNGAPWRKLKRVKLRQNPLCERCSTWERPIAATIVHHVLERKDRPDLALDIDNLESLCGSCHSRHHGHKRNQ